MIMADWIPIADAKINNDKRYEVTYETGNVAVRCGKVIAEVVGNIIAVREYNPTPYVAPKPIDPGDGWRWLEVGELKRASDEWTVGKGWETSCNEGQIVDKPFVYRRRIEPTYRPFANAAEYKPHRERWLVSKHGNDWLRLKSFSDESDWDALYELWLFEDTGTPFGVEVTK